MQKEQNLPWLTEVVKITKNSLLTAEGWKDWLTEGVKICPVSRKIEQFTAEG